MDTDHTGADLTGCRIYGVSARNLKLERAKQQNLIITPVYEPEIIVDNIEVAQFIYLLLNNQKIRDVINTITSKAVEARIVDNKLYVGPGFGGDGEAFIRRLRAMGIRDRPISARSPWQNGLARRVVGSIRRDCLDHVVICGEQHLRHLLSSY